MVDENGCYNCISHSKRWDGYHNIKYGKKSWKAHRLVYELFNGEIEKGKVIMHMCDNPSCINPSHLKCGTHKENTQDMINKGRHKIIKKKLTIEEKIEIKSSKLKNEELSKKYNVGIRSIRRIRNEWVIPNDIN